MSRSRKHCVVTLAIVCAVLNPIVTLASCPNDRILHPTLQMLAGSGAPSQANGIARDAGFVGPLGVAIGPDVDPRGIIGPSLAGISQPKGTYRIVFFGDSFDFYGITWPESMQAQVEAGLARDHDSNGLNRCPSVIAIRYSGIDILDVASFVRTFLADGEADLVIVPVEGDLLGYAARKHPELSQAALDALIKKQLTTTQQALTASGTRILLVPVPYSTQVSPLELLALPADFLEGFEQARKFEDRVASFGMPTFRLAAEMEKAERGPNRVAFGSPDDPHPSSQGFTWIGKAILRYLESWKPWSR